MKRKLWNTILIVLVLAFLASPVLLYAVLYFGWPPVLGNLTAAHTIKSYAAQVHPDWKAEGFWADYNLVDGGYHLGFSHGEESVSLRYDRDRSGGLVHDRKREDALRETLEIDRAVRASGFWVPDRRVAYWSARWRPGDPETPYITLRVDFYDAADAPVLTEEAMRAAMADRALEVYSALAPLAPVDRFSVYYCHRGVRGKDPGLVWNVIYVDLPPGEELTREQVLAAPLSVR